MAYFNNRRGIAMIEFAIIIPIFIFMLYGLAYLSMVFHDYLTLSEMTRDIARHESVGITFDKIKANYSKTTFLTDVYLFNPDTDVKVDTQAENSQNPSAGQNVTVTLTAKLNIAKESIWHDMLPSIITASLTMRKEE